MKNIKAHLLMGQSLCMLYKEKRDCNRIESGIKRMKKALSLCSSQQKRKFEDQIRKSIFKARKLLFLINKEEEDKEKNEIFKEIKLRLNKDKKLSNDEKTEILDSYKELVLDDSKLTKDKIPAYFICYLTNVSKKKLRKGNNE